MDVYGYPSYQYNQSDELAKQMYAHQALASSLPYPQNLAAEPHIMPAPSGAPWNLQAVPSWGSQSRPQLVQFTGQPLCTDKFPNTLVPHCKRKSLDIEPAIPAKQLITEEKMAAHLNSLHISSDFTKHSLAFDEYMDMDSPSTSGFNDKLKSPRIVLSEEIKKLQEEPILPASLIERLEKPHMSLVVWKPRENILDKIVEVEEKKKDNTEEVEEPKRRNGVLVPEHTGMDVEM